MASRLDELALALTEPMSRRRAMRLTVGAAAAAYLGRPAARAAGQSNPRCPQCDEGTSACRPNSTDRDACPSCCLPSEKCCVGAPGNLNAACCDADLFECGPLNFYGSPSCVCRPENICQGINDPLCCRPDETCIVRGGQEPVCCKHPCGKEECCASNEDCVMRERRAPDRDFCARRCPTGRVHCPGTGTCCDRSGDCCGEGCCSAGQCCQKEGKHWCCPDTQVCGDHAGTCGCSTGRSCGDKCCPAGSECCRVSVVLDIFNIFGRDAIRVHRYSCCSPGLERDLLDHLESIPPIFPFGGFFQSASTSGARRVRGRAAASPGSADALDALAGVANLAALASDRLRSGRPDSRYRRPVRARRPALARISPGPGLDAAAAAALDKLVSAEVRAWTLVDAAAMAHARSLGAIRAHNARAAVSQARASGQFSARAAKALRPVPGLRKAAAAALQRAGTPEVTVTSREVVAFQRSVRRSGLPADMRARLTQLGLDSSEQKRVAKLIVGRRPESGAGNVLIAPLADASTLTSMGELAKLLARRAARSRKQPITVSQPGPRTVAGTSPRRHASQSSVSRRGRARR